ncbi:NADH dehydrogenase subunit C [endosymbiont of Ridgeia piscesae]|jgi:NADH-quinone oxidoreductase subunit C|uniref:NADH-quinone oxidoreductase subunit C n=2 Tax=endosymbiont of Ridgeia piscesae TaxID=54398 RepID=A0A0T5YUW4_9GAMM|nr:NADH dehydrogenase subunit C [endosymbiont of Ridgeia piscesae]KRT56935.1 NADH-quinone oxidoreductase subunit C [endosymbiont of Ridgeia piscesae]
MSSNEQSPMQLRLQGLVGDLEERFSALGCDVVHTLGEVTMRVPRQRLLEVAVALRDEDAFRFEEVVDVCGVDYSTYGQGEWQTEQASAQGFGRGVQRDAELQLDAEERFAVVYHLLSVANNMRLRLRVFGDAEQPVVPSVVEVWRGADWFEREAFDLYGILFDGHPDLRRILTDYGFIGHPFRKDFPLIGQVEMRYDPEQQRVIYEPVSIESRTLVPRVVRNSSSAAGESPEQQDSADA